MKKLFFYLTILPSFIFTNCKKEDYNPAHNHLVATDHKSYSISCKPTNSAVKGQSSSAFEIYTTGSATNGFDIYMSFGQGVPNPVVFSSTDSSQGVTLYIHYYTGTSWTATSGIVQMEVENRKHPSEKCPKSAKINLNDMQFICDPLHNNSGMPDTLWVSGIVNAHRIL